MRIALLGVGHWHAPIHLDAIRAAGASVAPVWDADAGVAAAFAAHHGAEAAASRAEAIRGADLVVAMGRPAEAEAVALAALAAARPVILEKPAAVDAPGLARLQAAATGRFVAVPLPNRLGPAMAGCARLAAAGRLGRIGHAHFRLVNGPPERYRSDGVGWMLDPALSGGGALRNLGIHGVDCAAALATGALRVVSSHVGTRLRGGAGIEDHALVSFEDDAGALFTVEAGYTYAALRPGGDFEWRIAAENATLVDRGDTATVATLDDGAEGPLAPLAARLRYRAFLAETLACLADGRPPPVGLDDYARAMALIDQAYGRGA